MAVLTYTKTGTKATTPAKLDKQIFGVEIKNHELLKSAYIAYLANGRGANAVTKTRGLISGGGRKPWRQKGTGRARFGSSRNPIWRGGGVVFGPDGTENYSHNLAPGTKRQALKQALTLANKDGKLRVIETFDCKEGKVAATVKLLGKLDTKGSTLIVVSVKDQLVEQATRNLESVKAVQAGYLNTFDVLNADTIIISQKSLDILNDQLNKKREVK